MTNFKYVVHNDCTQEDGGGYYEICSVFSTLTKANEYVKRMERIAEDTDVFCDYMIDAFIEDC